MEFKLRSGLNINIESDSDKDVFTDIFVHRVYEPALYWAIKLNSNFALDLGCNTGLFSLFAFDYFYNKRLQYLAINGVDASTKCLIEFKKRVDSNHMLQGKVGLIKGLVGKLEGHEYFKELDYSAMNSISTTDENASKIDYINLNKFLAQGVDLIKCDIEGSEGDFIDNYENLLRNCKVFTVEFHDRFINVEKSRDKLFSYGLSLVEKEVTGNCSIETFINAKN